MSEISKCRHELTLRPMDTSVGTWDGAAVFYLEGNDFLAFVADAPVKARQESSALIAQFIKSCLPKFKERLATSHRELTALLLADLGTAVGQHLLLNGSGSAYAACIFVLARGEAIFVLSIGDCAAYLLGENLIRLSEATRVGGASVLSIFASRDTKPETFLSGSYLGAAPRAFSQRDVTVLPNRDIRTLVLVSDGAEQQVGLDRLNQLLSSSSNVSELKARFNELLTGPLIDDVTLLAVTVEPCVDGLENSVVQIQQRLDMMNQEVSNTLTSFSRYAEDLESKLQTLDQGYRTLLSDTGRNMREFEASLKNNDGRAAQMGEQLHQIQQQFRELNAKSWSSGQGGSVSSTASGDVVRLNSDLLAVKRECTELRSQINRLKNQLELGPSVHGSTRRYGGSQRAWLVSHWPTIILIILAIGLAFALFFVVRWLFAPNRVEPPAREPAAAVRASPQPTANNSSNDLPAEDEGRDQPVRERHRPRN